MEIVTRPSGWDWRWGNGCFSMDERIRSATTAAAGFGVFGGVTQKSSPPARPPKPTPRRTPPRHPPPPPPPCPHPAHRAQEPVADRMAPVVVVVLEVVHVSHQDRQGTPVARGPLELAPDAVLEGAGGRQTGEVVQARM